MAQRQQSMGIGNALNENGSAPTQADVIALWNIILDLSSRLESNRQELERIFNDTEYLQMISSSSVSCLGLDKIKLNNKTDVERLEESRSPSIDEFKDEKKVEDDRNKNKVNGTQNLSCEASGAEVELVNENIELSSKLLQRTRERDVLSKLLSFYASSIEQIVCSLREWVIQKRGAEDTEVAKKYEELLKEANNKIDEMTLRDEKMRIKLVLLESKLKKAMFAVNSLSSPDSVYEKLISLELENVRLKKELKSHTDGV